MPDHNYVKTSRGIVDLVALKQRIDLTELYGDAKLYCLWHDDTATPNLQVYHDHVYCFACGHVADAVSFVMQIEGVNFYDAVAYLLEHQHDKAVVRKIDTEPLSIPEIMIAQNKLFGYKGSTAWTYLQDRGLDNPIITAMYLGTDYSTISIPHFVNGQCVNIKYRNLTGNGPKYNSLPNREFKYLYPYDYFRIYYSDSKVLFLTEGEFDAMILLQAGLPAMSVPAGVNTPLDQYMMFLKQFKRVFMLFDLDEAGQKAANRVFFKRLNYGLTLAEAIAPTVITKTTWMEEWGKDVTEARKKLIPHLITMLNE